MLIAFGLPIIFSCNLLLSLYHFFGNELKGDLLTIGFSLT
jgi:hypothetical protein